MFICILPQVGHFKVPETKVSGHAHAQVEYHNRIKMCQISLFAQGGPLLCSGSQGLLGAPHKLYLCFGNKYGSFWEMSKILIFQIK